MGDINVKIWFRKFGIVTSNEGVGDDEPFVWVFYYRVDGPVTLQPVDTARLPFLAPPATHSNVHFGNVLVAPYEGRIEPGGLGPLAFVGLAVVFIEEDATPDGTIDDARAGAIAEGRRQCDALLRKAIREKKLIVFEPDKEAFVDAIFASVFGDTLLTAVSGVVTPFLLGQVVDPDDFVGVGHRELGVAELVANNHRDTEFRIESDANGEGKYYVECSARRTDTDEVPVVAAMRTGPKTIKVLARNVDDKFAMYRSTDAGATFEGLGLFKEARTFRSGPAACASADGAHRHVVGLSTDDLFFHTRTDEKGDAYTDSAALGERQFKSSPAVACSADGRLVHVVGRGKDDRYWHRFSDSFGRRWSAWSPIREFEFRSTPTVVVTPDGKRVMVAGLRHDGMLLRTVSNDNGEHWGKYEPIPVSGNRIDEPMHRCTSAPAAAVVSTDGKLVDLVCRGADLTFHHTTSPDGGLTWEGRWSHLALPHPAKPKTFASAPAIVWVDGEAVYVGLGKEDLMLWRCIKTGGTWKEPWDPKLEWSPVLRDKPPFDIHPMYY